jgi:hypothetical protein
MGRKIKRMTEVLALLNRGRFAEALDAELTEAIETLEALTSEQGKATVTITLNLAFQSGRLDIAPAVKSKLPESKSFAATPFWATDGALSVEHPSQSDMFGPRGAAEPAFDVGDEARTG